jgi:hypothetical protein
MCSIQGNCTHTTCYTSSCTSRVQAGQPTDGPRLAELVAQMLVRTGCDNCLVWAKSDALVAAVKALLPGQRCGYVLLAPSPEARRMGLDRPLRTLEAEVGGGAGWMAVCLPACLAGGGKLQSPANSAEDASMLPPDSPRLHCGYGLGWHCTRFSTLEADVGGGRS